MEIADIHLCCDFPPPLNGIAEVLEHGEMELRELRKAALRALRMCARGVPYEEAMRCPHVRQVGRHATVTFPSLLDSYAGNVTWGMVVSAHLSCAGVTFRVRDDCFPRAPAKGDRRRVNRRIVRWRHSNWWPWRRHVGPLMVCVVNELCKKLLEAGYAVEGVYEKKHMTGFRVMPCAPAELDADWQEDLLYLDTDGNPQSRAYSD
jgi:hypothetical protein